MYAGHIGVALGLKRSWPLIPLWMLVIASELPDWTDAGLCISGVRTPVYGMLSHSLPAVAVLAILAGTVAVVIGPSKPNGELPVALRTPASLMALAGPVALAVALHMVGDWFTGLKPTWPGGPMIGLQLYRMPVVDFLLEAVVVILGWLAYRATLPQNPRAARVASLLLASLLILQLAADVSFALVPGLKKC